jgi:hypothetical protein
MSWRLDQVIYWREGNRVVVRVELFDPLGRRRQEDYHPPTADFAAALRWAATQLSGRGPEGQPRVRQKQGSSLRVVAELQRVFWEALRAGE